MAITRNLRGASLAHIGDVEGALADYATARRHAHDPDAQMRYYVNYSDLLNLLGRYREAVQVAEEGHASARALGVERTTGSILAQNLAQALLELGEIERAEDVLARELDLRTFTTFRLYSTLTRVRVLAWRGQAEEAAALLHRYRHELDAVAPMERQVWYYLRQARIAVDQATGDSAAALSSVLLVLDDECPHTLHRVRLLLEAGAVVLAQRINSAAADEVAARIADAWSALPNTLRPAPWSRILDALLNPTHSTLHTAVACSDGDDVPAPFRIVTRLALAHALVDAGERPAAADALTQAREAAAALQHEPFITQVREFAHATGLFDDDGAPRLADLTAREAQVLELLTEGLSNGEIGQRLFISVKTVSVHVSAILRKLDVTSRTEAAVLAARGED